MYLFACLLMAIGFVGAKTVVANGPSIGILNGSPIGTAEGALFLLPYLRDATDGFFAVANGKNAVSKALENTNNCGFSGSNTPLLNAIDSNENLSKALSALAQNLRNQTDDSGQLKIVTGDLSEITDQIEKSAIALKALAKVEQQFADNINTVSLKGVDRLVSALKDLLESSKQFNTAFTNTSLIYSRLLLQAVSTSVISNFTNSVKALANSYDAQGTAFKTVERY